MKPCRPRSGFTLLELLVAVAITLVLAGIMLAVVTGTLTLWHRTQDGFSTDAQAKLVLDMVERDFQAAVFRRDGSTWLAVDDLKKALGKEWGCNLISMAFLVFIVGYVIYWFASGGEPQNKKFFDDCYNRRTREFLPGYEPDFVREQAVAACMREQRRSLGLNPN